MLTMALLCTGASAAIITGLEDMPGDGKYMGSAYVENYAFDSEKLGIMDGMDKIGLAVVNVIFSLCRYAVFYGLRLFRLALTLNVADLMGSRLDSIQAAMRAPAFLWTRQSPCCGTI